ncbi:BatD family protein [Mucilaginibacter sp. L3T2-6]|uniref:BatD family protein n=1 Tax=Mucilaginibacter sp. L3T2-6 TaxID=3062491 RepID=UPI00267624FA|nr:BatD family protein [Mucilaginibacter sp. L3T2-6]MDO3640867.1 BatD family protein [Mucilaginibacter sp. L3T2-6]MDV6213657.1 BatD family protein [Mucilaginibacter sp. L3T2-6]
MKPKYSILILLLFWTGALLAQEVKFTAQASKTTVGTGEQFQVDFTVNGNASDFNPPAFSAFQVLSGPNQSTSMESINGNTTVTASLSYILMAVKEGEFTIGPATCVVNGKKYTTGSLKIKVVKGRPVPQGAAQQAGSEGTIETASGDIAKNIFLKAVVDKTDVYQGQQLTVNFRLYTRIGIDDSRVDKVPDLTGFWNEDINKPQQQQQVQWKVETYKGQKYNTADIKQTILFPEHSGNITIDPFQMTFLVRQPVQSRDIMDQFFGGSFKQVKYVAKSTPVVIHVKPLPETGKPDSFTGAVGTFNIETSVDRKELKANETLNYKVRITGAGNIKLLNTINVNFPADFEKYDPKITDSTTERLSGVSGSRFYNYLLIPRHEGEYTIDPVKFSYFNPATNRYYTVASKAFKIKVNKGVAESNVTALAGENKQDIKMLDKDIRYIKTNDTGLAKNGDGFFGSIPFYLLLLLGPVACIAAFNYRNRMMKFNSDIVAVKNRRASRIAAKHMANAQKQLQANNTALFYEDVFKGMYGYLSDKLNIPYANLNRENIATTLNARLPDEVLVNRVLETLDLCEMARFAPVTHITKEEVFEKAKGIISDIENKI